MKSYQRLFIEDYNSYGSGMAPDFSASGITHNYDHHQIQVIEKTVECTYCGCIRSVKDNYCESCGAPLF